METILPLDTSPRGEARPAKRRVMLVVPDGMGIRNFLCGRLVPLLSADHEILILHGLPEEVRALHETRLGRRVSWLRLPGFREGIRERLCRTAKVHARLRRSYRGATLRALLAGHRPPRRLKPRLLERAARMLGGLNATDRGVRRLDRHHANWTRRASYFDRYVSLLSGLDLDLVFLTHQRASAAVPVMLAARELGIPTASFIYSWDNAPKGRLAVHSDHYLVWSKGMREEFLRIHPQIDPAQIHITGTPQFECYFDASVPVSRRAFLDALGLRADRPVICFSGDDVATSPFDPIYLADLAGALRGIPERKRPQLIFRRCPSDTGARYREVLARFPEIAVADPAWSVPADGTWTQAVPTPEDLVRLSSLVEHCDAVVNFASTMCMDFAIKGKPGLYLRYEVDPGRRWSVEDIYGLPHFANVHRLQPVHWITDRDRIAGCVLHALANPEEQEQKRRSWIDAHVAAPLAGASERIRDTLLDLARAPHACTSDSS